MESQGFFTDLRKFIFSFTFMKHFTASLLLGFVLVLLAVFFMNGYTGHGESISAPGFKGLTIEQAQALADEKDVRIEIQDSVFNASGKPGTIVEQNPPADFKVKENRTIFLTIKAFTPEMITMPKLINLSLIQTKADLETYGLKVGKLIYKPGYKDIVLEQRLDGKKIAPGAKVEKGSKIDLVLGRDGDLDNTSAPSLIGLSLEQAEQKIGEMTLNTGKIVFDETVETEDDSLNARVVKQYPGKNISLIPGSEIDIWLSLDTDSVK